jgi:hypothetical protein
MVETTIQARILLSTVKRNVLVDKVCKYCIVLAIVHIILNASYDLYDSVVINILSGLIVGFAYLLNHWKHHRTSKVFVLFSLNFLCLFHASVLPQQVGVYLYFFPLVVASSALFDSGERGLRYFFVALPMALLFALVLSDFNILADFSFKTPVNEDAFFAVNAFSSAILTILLVNFMQKLNGSSERELKELAEEVNGKNIRLQKTNAELDRFLYSTSHDLRSPLSSIKGLVNIARMETAEEKVQQYFDMMIDRVDKLDFFIKDIIDYSKNARTDIRTEPVDFNSLLTEVTENHKYIEGAGSIRFLTEVSFTHPVNADKNRLSVVLNNLMANAIKYHDPSKEKQWIEVQVTNSEGTVKVRISDNGTGIEPEHQTKIFDMFYRGTFQSKGSGLGLYIVKETLAKMKGTILVESSPGKGSSFLITFPVS